MARRRERRSDIPANGKVRLARERAGMTLLEVMIAGGVLTIGFVLLFGSIISISATGSLSEDRATAVAHMSSVLEEVRGLAFNDLLDYQPPALPGLGAAAEVEAALVADDGAGGLETLGVLPASLGDLAAAPPNPATVRVTVRWRDRAGRTLTTSAVTMVGR